MIRCLNLVGTIPYPPRSGGEWRAWSLITRLSSRLQQTVLGRVMSPLSEKDRAAFQQRDIRLLALHLPRPSGLAKIIKGFYFLAGSHPVAAAGWYFNRMRQALRDLLRREPFDLILVETSWLAAYWPECAASPARKVIDLYDINGERLLREAALEPAGWRRWLARQDARRMAGQERSLVESADLTLVTSPRDEAELQKLSGRGRIVVTPNGVDTDALSPLPAPTDPFHVLFVGSLNYGPNADGALFFAREVWPLVRQRYPDARFTIVGRAPPPEIRALAAENGIEVAGEVPDVEPYYRRCAACVVPLRAGGGTRLKVLEAMAYARPVISTRLGAEGIDVEHGRHLLLADESSDFAGQTLAVLENRARAAQLGAAGRQRVEQAYSWSAITDALYARLEELVRGSK
jgi:sugar transferase (PEP-CTERM/EpsH1 system associated)